MVIGCADGSNDRSRVGKRAQAGGQPSSEPYRCAKIAADREAGICTIELQNENLIVHADGETLAIVPDIISVLDAETAIPITNENLRYGQRVALLAVRVPEIMRSEAALAQFGPAAFGMNETYVPLSPD